MENWKDDIIRYFPPPMRAYIALCPDDAREIRIRAHSPLLAVNQRALPLAYIVTPSDMQTIFMAMCEHSPYAKEEQLKNGYVALMGGHRAGIAGRYTAGGDMVNVSSICLRVARQVPGAGADVVEKITRGGRVQSALLFGEPGSGKTTCLRDMARLLSKEGYTGITVLDERGEIAAPLNGIAMLDVGAHSDVLAMPKAQGMMFSVRNLSPKIIICDEIGHEEDGKAVFEATLAGVFVIASAHAGNIQELTRKKALQDLLFHHCFTKILHLGARGSRPGAILAIYDNISGEPVQVSA